MEIRFSRAADRFVRRSNDNGNKAESIGGFPDHTVVFTHTPTPVSVDNVSRPLYNGRPEAPQGPDEGGGGGRGGTGPVPHLGQAVRVHEGDEVAEEDGQVAERGDLWA